MEEPIVNTIKINQFSISSLGSSKEGKEERVDNWDVLLRVNTVVTMETECLPAVS